MWHPLHKFFFFFFCHDVVGMFPKLTRTLTSLVVESLNSAELELFVRD